MLWIKLPVLAALFFTCAFAHQRIFRSRKGTLDLDGDTLIISCRTPTKLITDIFSPQKETVSVRKIAVSLCKIPEKPLVDVFKELNISVTNMDTLALNYVDMDENSTEGLSIKTLELKTKRKTFSSSEKFFKPLVNLSNLTISGAEIPSLPPALEILNIYSDASVRSWNGCDNLKELTIWRVQSKKQLSEEWPESCSRLKKISLIEVSEEPTLSVIESIVSGSPNLKTLSMQSCKLHRLPFEKLHSNIDVLDLRNNRISGLNREQSSQLFGSRTRRVWFSGNPIVCTCENNRLLEALHMNQSQVPDYADLLCAENKYPIQLVSVPELCRFVVMSNLEYGMGYVWGLCCSISVMSVVLLVVTRRYGHTVRTILYSRGFCVSCFKDGIDSDRPYDAFLSFSHGDDQFVLEQLLPRLEDAPNEFRVCIHYRDWAVGEWIPAQIMQSVRLSKRTIIVLSKNFVKSWWGVLEFRYAHASAMAEGRSRLLVLILDDVLSEKLAPELQGYLEYHTFLRCSDPFFWDKLRYAMPHRDNTEDVI